MKKWLTILIVLFTCFTGNTQGNKAGAWYSYGGKKSIPANLEFRYLLQYRSTSITPHLGRFLLLGGIKYKIPQSKWALGLYYYQIETNMLNVSETLHLSSSNFLVQEISYSHQWKTAKFYHRARLEQYWKEAGGFFQHSRFFASVKIPIPQISQRLNFYTYSELFISLNNDVTFNRDRIFGGLTYKMHNQVELQLGYMSEIFSGKHRDQLILGVFHSL